MNHKIEFNLINTRVRPPRIVTLFNINDSLGKESLLRIIERNSDYWGGAFNIIVPTDGMEIKEEFWKLLENYNPDYFIKYEYTNSDFSKAKPEVFDKIIEDEAIKYSTLNGENEFENIKKNIRDTYLKSSATHKEFEIDTQLKNKLLSKLNPFYVDYEYAIQNSIGNYTQIRNILKNFDADLQIIEDFQLSFKNLDIEMLIRSYTGSSIYVRENLNDRSVREILSNEKELNIKYNITDISENNFYQIQDFIENKKQTPFNIVSKDLIGYYKYQHAQHYPSKIFIIIGDSIEDFCYYYSLKSMINTVVWLPLDIINNYEFNDYKNIYYTLARILFRKIRNFSANWRIGREIAVTSFSLGEEIMEKVNNLFKDSTLHHHKKLEIKFENLDKIDYLFKDTIEASEEQNRNNFIIEQFIDNLSVNYLNTPVPKSFKYISAFDYNWITDLKIFSADKDLKPKEGYFLPTSPIFSKDIFADPVNRSYHDNSTVRFSKDGISYVCPNMGLIDNSNVDIQTVSPRLRKLDEFEVFSRLFSSIECDIKYSDKGNYTKQAIKLFGTIENMVSMFMKDNLYNLFSSYCIGSNGKKKTDKSIIGVNVGNRTYLKFDDIVSFIKEPLISREQIDQFIEDGILFRGFILKCSNCNNSEWYSLNKINESFECTRCYAIQLISYKNWRDPFEPSIFYKLNEVLFQGLSHNMLYPILTLNYIKESTNDSFLYSPEIIVENKKSPNETFECDIVCISDGELIIGEVKQNEELPQKLNLYNSISNKLNAQFVLSTFAENWSFKNMNKVNRLTWNKTPKFLSKNELLKLNK